MELPEKLSIHLTGGKTRLTFLAFLIMVSKAILIASRFSGTETNGRQNTVRQIGV